MRFLYFFLGALAAIGVSGEYIKGRAFDRFITIWLENQDYSKTSADSHVKAIAKEGIMLTQYYGLTHPSQPNYIASVAGDYFGLNHDDWVRIPENVSTVIDLFDTKSIEWRGYFEGMPGPGYMGLAGTDSNGNWNYVRKHNPFASFDSVNLNGSRLLNLQSLDAFNRDVKAKRLPQYAHISPDMLNDGHDTSLSFSTEWAHDFLKPLLANKDFMKNTLVLLTFDESETYTVPNRIVSILLGGALPKNAKGTQDDTVYNHYSILSTLESNWGLSNLGRYDVGANVFKVLTDKTGYLNQDPENVASINNSLSYSGFLNNDITKYESIPPPNLRLIGAGGQGVVDTVKKSWANTAKMDSPYDGSGNFYDGGDGISNPNAPTYKPQAQNSITIADVNLPSTSGSAELLHWDIPLASLAVLAFVMAAYA